MNKISALASRPAPATETMTGAEMVMRALADQGVDTIFGYPGGAALPMYDALFRQNYVRHILVRHEQGAGHMAEGYARATGKTGVVMVTSGPGATNTVTPLMDALSDSTPMVVITGQVASNLIGSDAFQECDTVGITRSASKHNYLVKNIADLPYVLHEAFHLAASGRPGPVLVDIPKDVQNMLGEYRFFEPHEFPLHRTRHTTSLTLANNNPAIAEAAELIARAERPVFYTGGGVNGSGDDAVRLLRSLARHTGIPVTSTLMGLGAFPASDPQWLGMLGMHGRYEANMAMHDADLIVAIGSRFDDRITGKVDEFAPHAKIVHIDIDESKIHKIRHADVAIVEDCGMALSSLLPAVMAITERGDLKEWWAQINRWRAIDSLRYTNPPDGILPQHAIRELFRIAREEVGPDRRIIVTTDVGQHQMFAAQHWPVENPRDFITSGGLGTMGYGLPAAIGAQIADPEALVICISGDGSIQMNSQELIVAAQEGLSPKVMIINNGKLGMVWQWQDLIHEKRFSQSDILQPDFVKLAEASYWTGLRCADPNRLEDVLREMITAQGPVLADIRILPDIPCLPMIASGSPHHQMILPNDPK
ncbi:MAG: biosynthetic-type acetolactate synthase large subunit [Alphaproteobacteria bacterium]|nr:biosynthetic-type acetolactate synthase large subunit [Alphaproteobacteria bacterium]